MTPDATLHNPSPEYIRGLIAASGLSQHECARRIGIGVRALRYYCAEREGDFREAPYLVQFALECLAANHITDRQPHPCKSARC